MVVTKENGDNEEVLSLFRKLRSANFMEPFWKGETQHADVALDGELLKRAVIQ